MQKTLQDIPVCCCRQPAVFAEPVDIPQDVFPGNVFGRALRQKAADDLQVVSGGCFCMPAPKEMALISIEDTAAFGGQRFFYGYPAPWPSGYTAAAVKFPECTKRLPCIGFRL